MNYKWRLKTLRGYVTNTKRRIEHKRYVTFSKILSTVDFCQLVDVLN